VHCGNSDIWLHPMVGVYIVYNRKRFFQAGNRIFNNLQYLHCNHCVGELSDSLKEFRLYLGFHFCRDIPLCVISWNWIVRPLLCDTHTHTHTHTLSLSLSLSLFHIMLISITDSRHGISNALIGVTVAKSYWIPFDMYMTLVINRIIPSGLIRAMIYDVQDQCHQSKTTFYMLII